MTTRVCNPRGGARHPDDLSALERRGLLPDAERRRLQMALTASEELHCAHQLGRDFDVLETVCAGDAALIERVVGRVCGRNGAVRGPARSLWQRALPGIGFTSLLLASAVAGATLWPHVRTLVGATPIVSVPAVPEKQLPKAPRAMPPSVAAENRLAVGIEVAASATRAEAVASSRPNPSHQDAEDEVASSRPNSSHQDAEDEVASPKNHANWNGTEEEVASPRTTQLRNGDEDEVATSRPNTNRHDGAGEVGEIARELPSSRSAADLFSEANAARRRGDIEQSRRNYRALRAAYPMAKEAALSYALQARFELQHGFAAEALRQFDQYLLVAPRGPLAEESLEGRAAACRHLGRQAEEKETWRELLKRYPGSVYVTMARKRLGELP